MTDLLHRICSGIGTAEGAFNQDPTVPPRRNRNPGNLTASPLDRPKDKRFVVFRSDEEGRAALYQQVCRHILRGYTLRQLITKWAPPSENDTANYIAETVRRTGLNPDLPLWNYLTLERIP